jgi:SAM-dependent methyltransferase
VSPVPDAESAQARVGQSEKYTQDQLAKEAFFRRRAELLLERVEAIRPPGRLLDVGCAIGTELAVAAARGWSAIGLELSASSLAVARERGLDARGVSLERADFPNQTFDLVTLNHVLEHVPRPVPFLEKVHDVLAPGGLLFVALPNVRTWWFYVKRRRYTWTFQDDHFLHFSVATLSRLLESHGFGVLDCRTVRWRDYHDEPAQHGRWFRQLDALAERHGLGIEIFCLARRLDALGDGFAGAASASAAPAMPRSG